MKHWIVRLTRRLIDDFGAFRFEAREAVLHVLQLLDRVALPLRHLRNNAQRIARAVGEGWIAGNLLFVRLGSSSIGPVGSTR